MNNISERRKYPRIVKPYLVRFRVKPLGNRGVVSGDWDMVAVANLGADGIFYYAQEIMEVGTILDLKIAISLSFSIICTGKVIRVKKHPGISLIGYAIEFTNIKEHTRNIINSIVEDG